MKYYYLSFLLIFFTPPNTMDSGVRSYILVPGWIGLGLIILAIIVLGYIVIRRSKKKYFNKTIRVIDLPLDDNVVDIGWYLNGYPGSKETIIPSVIYSKNGKLHICKREEDTDIPETQSKTIPLEYVNDIKVEDAFTFKRKMDAERGELSREFVSYLEHKKETEIAFVLINWKKNLEEFHTRFCIEGPGAMERAILKRNALKGICEQNITSLVEV
jgi:hypothetical protein